MDRGYIKLWRKIFDSGWYTKPLTCHLAIHLILKANHKDKKFIFNKKEMVCKRGQLITGRNQLSKETGLSHKNIRTSLEILRNCGFLAIKSTNKFSIITICNYDSYQDKNIESGQQSGQQRASKGPAKGHKQECKNDKNKKNIVVEKSTTKNGRIKKEFTETDIEYQLANHLDQRHRKNNPDFEEINVQKGAHDIDLMIRKDKKTSDHIREVIDWLFDSDHKQAKFWRKQVRCAAKLRDKFGVLVDEMKDDDTKTKDPDWDRYE